MRFLSKILILALLFYLSLSFPNAAICQEDDGSGYFDPFEGDEDPYGDDDRDHNGWEIDIGGVGGGGTECCKGNAQELADAYYQRTEHYYTIYNKGRFMGEVAEFVGDLVLIVVNTIREAYERRDPMMMADFDIDEGIHWLDVFVDSMMIQWGEVGGGVLQEGGGMEIHDNGDITFEVNGAEVRITSETLEQAKSLRAAELATDLAEEHPDLPETVTEIIAFLIKSSAVGTFDKNSVEHSFHRMRYLFAAYLRNGGVF